MSSPCYLYLTCKDQAEAHLVSDALLSKRYIVCAKQIPVTSAYWWHGKIESDKEILLVMESDLKFFDTIEAILMRLHSYDTFVLQAVPIVGLSKKAAAWMQEELSDE